MFYGNLEAILTVPCSPQTGWLLWAKIRAELGGGRQVAFRMCSVVENPHACIEGDPDKKKEEKKKYEPPPPPRTGLFWIWIVLGLCSFLGREEESKERAGFKRAASSWFAYTLFRRLVSLILPSSYPQREMSAAPPEARASQGLFTNGRRIHSKSREAEAARREVSRRARQGMRRSNWSNQSC